MVLMLRYFYLWGVALVLCYSKWKCCHVQRSRAQFSLTTASQFSISLLHLAYLVDREIVFQCEY